MVYLDFPVNFHCSSEAAETRAQHFIDGLPISLATGVDLRVGTREINPVVDVRACVYDNNMPSLGFSR